ncbi:sulfatase-like hydrolase/transferase [Candidatus Saccharibacteria bacterium]|nr:sulfatase-like hydrolase/transferase [Candidatus Saccharibacteria bacterium]
MKKVITKLKESLGGILIALLLSLMLAFYEPINMYVGNMEEFWFDFQSFLPIIFLQFLIVFFVITAFFIIVNLINRKAYKIVLLVAFVCMLVTYIQGNFLVYNLPGLDGNPINWDEYMVDKVISILLWVVIIVVSFILLRKLKFEKFEKIIKGSSIVIIIMLLAATVSLLVKPNVFDSKEALIATFDNFDNVSNDKNFFIFLVDQVDSVAFNEELSKNWDKREIFEDFTYYPDTSSTYMWTLYSVPYILSGDYYENEEDKFSDYFTNAFDNSPLFESLEKEGYDLSIYEDEEILNYKGNNLTRFNNIKSGVLIRKKELVKQEVKYVLFKYLPYPLKWMAKINNLDINSTKASNDANIYASYNDVVYSHMKNNDLNKVGNKCFSFIHVVGAHPPFIYDKDVNRQPEGTYVDGVNAGIAMVKEYLERLREGGVYDNSVIIIMSDHGHGEETIQRSNPILYIKGINEKHDYVKSDKKVSFEYLSDAYAQLLKGDKSEQLFTNVDGSKRRVLYSELYNPNLTEYMQTGHAWDTKTLVKTGNQYLREK